ncbi:MAG: diguanylate cyclase [Xanthobacteraceae bacterium]|nr:diguanylate cyclase [Xanthobacteraceae bacterium]
MPLDVPTLFIVSIFVTTILGLFLLFAWIQDRSIRALAWWGVAYLIGGLSVALFSVQDSLSDPLSVAIANALLFVACGVIWSGARLFHGREVLPYAMFAGALVWLFCMMVPGFAASPTARIIVSSLTISTYTLLTAFELWCGRKEPLVSRWPAMIVLFLHTVVFLTPIPIIVLLPPDHRYSAFLSGWFAIFALETLLYAIATAFIILAMAKERTERIHKTAATIDPLTSIFNRRALLDAGRRILRRQVWDNQPVGVLMFDLDFFKKINDRFGHATGDRALQLFAETASANLRATDIIGRLGGEEFAAVLPASNLAAAAVAAERVRSAFETAAVEIDGHPVKGTVSIGAAAAINPDSDIDDLLALADKALYAAKKGGRNRVVLADFVPGKAARAADEISTKPTLPGPGIAPAAVPLVAADAGAKV